ncbi:recombination protein RecU [Ligilactobacillus salitolerans]|uniref:Holliday junction resolvase RecU n=1 Tax=Ligilactobacillus salitolerans TaxID=1808352 RepID=A0A401IWC8_9LACO|nr:Holliday junction resolvase RecU [Ligilactobacillus salitolerans]GBG95806.1 recombination protein RecU [Ligilactobacillus salitolerans]
MIKRYPNGTPYQQKLALDQTIKFKSKTANENVIYGNRGMSLEEEINLSNKYYLETNVAVIHKKPLPIQIVNVDYPKRSAAVIKEAYFKQASTTDYNGVYRGRYIDFEAKETRNRASFPLSNFHDHQIKHMKACIRQGGICFALVKFVAHQEIYLLPATVLFTYWDRRFSERKSIPYTTIQEQGFLIDYQINPRLPYLQAVDLLIENLNSVN